ncbi:Electron transfer flavoprotein alpha-subunit [Thelotrema lepadinum]|nr:Electron transfer flavoprotein alpha-subunit [Thelotrema lepadinum]
MFAPRTALRSLRPHLLPKHLCHNHQHLSRLLSTLALLEVRSGSLLGPSASSITAATKINGPVTALLAGSNIQSAAESASKIEGVSSVLTIENEAYDRGLPENYAPLVAENVKKGGFSHVVATHSAFGKNLLPRVAALLDVQMVSDVMSIESEDSACLSPPSRKQLSSVAFVRPIYAGNAILTVQSSDPIKTFTVRQTSFPPSEPSSNTAPIESGVDPKAPAQLEFVSEDLTTSERPDLSTATRVVSGGRGLKSAESFNSLMPPLADALGAAIGASRAAVDSGFADNSLQVGQTGKNVAPQLYLSVGISGAIQHLAGMKDSKVIAAINKDPDAPIFGVADVGLVGDLFEKVPELTEKLNKAK